jgi:ubiquinone/menaquinone biosynthesis C-methylase UbiE
MPELDNIAETNRKGSELHPSVPFTDLNAQGVIDYINGKADKLPHPYSGAIYPPFVLKGKEGKNVLCLASGGGQQSAFWGIAGADVTVFDIAKNQLDLDEKVSKQFGYKVKTIQGDMRNLACFQNQYFDHVDMGVALYAIPDLKQVYKEIARILKIGGTCRIEHINPATYPIEANSWDGIGYKISVPYSGGRFPPDDQNGYSFRHLFSEIFNYLITEDMQIKGVWESPFHLNSEIHGEPGTAEHCDCFVQYYFAIVAEKRKMLG